MPTAASEFAIEPDLAITDSHHHLYPQGRYELADLERDLQRGHCVQKTVFVSCGVCYRATGPAGLMPVGETEWLCSLPTSPGVCSGIVGHADMFLGANVGEVLDAHVAAAGDRFKGIRHIAAWDPHPAMYKQPLAVPANALLDQTFRRGTALLAKRGLAFETWLYFTQLDDVAALARAQPDLTIVVDHLGGPARTGPYAGDPSAMLSAWRRRIAVLASCPNVYLKLGGIGFAPFVAPELMGAPRTSDSIARFWRPDMLYCIEQFTPQRCMFESNYPADSKFADYVVLWNAYKKITAELTVEDRRWLFDQTATTAYGL